MPSWIEETLRAARFRQVARFWHWVNFAGWRAKWVSASISV
jgi:hypothetical protein